MATDDGRLARLLMRANVGEPVSVIDESTDLLRQSGWTTDERLELLITKIRAQVRASRIQDAMASATSMYVAAVEAGSIGRQVQALAYRADALLNLQQNKLALELLLSAELALASSNLDALTARSRFALANAYTELGFHELAVEHCRRSVDDLTALGTAPHYLGTALINLAFRQLDFAIELGRIGRPDKGMRPEQFALLRESAANLERHRALPLDAQVGLGPQRERHAMLIGALLDPRAGIDGLVAVIHDAGGDVDLNEAISLRTALAQVFRMLGRTEEALAVSAEAAAMTVDPSVYPTTEREARYQLHESRLAAGDPGSVGVDLYVKSCERSMWDHRTNSLEGFLARRDLLILKHETDQAREMAFTDPLTGAHNRRALADWLVAHPVGPVNLAMVDIDHFKALNDSHGHEIGDVALRRLAVALRAVIGPADLVVRYGGDEFIVASEGGPADLATFHERIVTAVSTVSMTDSVPTSRFRASVGSSTVAAGQSTSGMVGAADREMFRQKRAAKMLVAQSAEAPPTSPVLTHRA